jgi:small subunit ribosomal protein S17
VLPSRTPEERAGERADRRSRKAAERRRYRVRSRERRRAAPRREAPAPAAESSGKPRIRQGVVVSDRADKTITVRIVVTRAHRTYGKMVRSSSTLHVHDEGNEANAGDTVRVVESRPLSRTKRWRLVEILERAR